MASIFEYKPLRMPAYVVFASGLVELAATFGVFVLAFLLGRSAPGLGFLAGLTFVALPLRFIAFVVLSYRANASLRALEDPPLAFTPAGMIGWYLVPLVGFVQPYRAMREVLSHIGDGDENGFRLHAWWISWVAYQTLVVVPQSSDVGAIALGVIGFVHLILQCAFAKLLSDRMDAFAYRSRFAATETASVFA